ncbi:MAG: hypothetical protein COB36_02440 [Alphaproteobacteria bacterium]|nr:MAG: hypothetical protein COB36_02440 [Alphaproteobacteria bacterium]
MKNTHFNIPTPHKAFLFFALLVTSLCVTTPPAFARKDGCGQGKELSSVQCDPNAKPEDIFLDMCHTQFKQTEGFCGCSLDFYRDDMLAGHASSFDYYKEQFKKAEKLILASPSMDKATLDMVCNKLNKIDEYNFLNFMRRPLDGKTTPKKIRKDLNEFLKTKNTGLPPLAQHCANKRTIDEFDAKISRRSLGVNAPLTTGMKRILSGFGGGNRLIVKAAFRHGCK